MLRSLFARPSLTAVPRIVFPRVSTPVRSLHASFVTLKKKGKKGPAKEVEEEVSETPNIDMKEVSQRLQTVVEKFTKLANEAKLGKTNPQVFDHLQVATADGEAVFTAVAQTALKGRNFIITVFDPANVKHVINSVLASDLNMNPIADPANKQMLKVPLPPVTTESKKENVKHLKTVYEKFRNGPGGSGKHAHTLAAIRADIKNKVAKKKKMTDEETKVWNEYEKLHKTFTDKLGDVFKAAETAMLK